MNHYDKLSKRDKKKHFSHELGSGKGDTPRKFSKEGDRAYRENKFWDKAPRS